MADLATPSAAEMSTIDAEVETPNASSKGHVQKPERPDEDHFRVAVEASRKEVDDARDARVSTLQANTMSASNSRHDSYLDSILNFIAHRS